MITLRHRRLLLAGAALAAMLPLGAFSAHGQEASVQEIRLRQLEASVRAMQRQVFPAGTDAAGQPLAGTGQAGGQAGVPATTAMTDMLTRMDAVEAQVARLTAHYEEMNNHLRQIDARLGTPSATTMAATTAPAQGGPTPLLAPESRPETRPATRPERPVSAATTRPSSERVAAVRAIVKPRSGDPADDDYTYGFKLWEAKFYPEAEQQLKLFLDQYPRHKKVSFARNLLGRAYMDDGQPREAAPWFLQNYQANKQGERAADSLLYLAQAMVALKDVNRACIALAEFGDSYKTEAAGRLKRQYADVRSSVSCN